MKIWCANATWDMSLYDIAYIYLFFIFLPCCTIYLLFLEFKFVGLFPFFLKMNNFFPREEQPKSKLIISNHFSFPLQTNLDLKKKKNYSLPLKEKELWKLKNNWVSLQLVKPKTMAITSSLKKVFPSILWSLWPSYMPYQLLHFLWMKRQMLYSTRGPVVKMKPTNCCEILKYLQVHKLKTEV